MSIPATVLMPTALRSSAVSTLSQTIAQGAGQSYGQRHQLGSLGAGTAEHHTLVTGTANLVVGAQSDVCRLGMDTALDLNTVGIKAVTGINIADLTDGFPGNRCVINHGLGGDLTADDAEVGGDHGFTGHAGTGVLLEACVQDGVRDGVGNLVGVAVGYTFRGKESFFHFEFLSFYYTTQNT